MGVKGIGRKPKSKDWFLEKAKEVHTDASGYCKYDYSLVEYINTKTKIAIICNESGHGVFIMAPYLHLRGSGCPKCNKGGRKPETTEWFINRANEIHGHGKYDYSRVDYKNNHEKVMIGCLAGHGYFYQSPYSHMKGYGCNECGRDARFMTKDEFVQRAQSVHGVDAYNYDHSVILGTKEKTKIYCNVCNEFFIQNVGNHINGSGCSNCFDLRRRDFRRSNRDEFILKATEIHGSGSYDYSEVVYVNSRIPVSIKCVKHNEYFNQSPNCHLSGQGCPKCGYERNGDRSRKTTEEFIDQSVSVHGFGKFDYSQVEYKSAHDPVLIICSEGHENMQTPANHLKGSECRACKYAEMEGIYTFENAKNNPEKYEHPAIFYRIRITNTNTKNVFEKVGITIRTVEDRFASIIKNGFEVENINIHKGLLLECMELEEFVLSEMKSVGMLYKVHDLKNINEAGWTECYYPKPWYNTNI